MTALDPFAARVSVVVPSYNRGDMLVEAISSIRLQTILPYQIIVVDDGSTDDTAARIEELNRGDITFIRFERNVGGATARNAGIDCATGDYVAFLDADDVWLPRKLEVQLRVAAIVRQRSDSFFIFSQLIQTNEHGEEHILPKRALAVDENVVDYVLVEDQTVQTSTILLPTRLAREVRFTDALLRHQDFDLVVKLNEAGARAIQVRVPLARWRSPPNGVRVSRNPDPKPSLIFAEHHKERLSKRQALSFSAKNTAPRIATSQPIASANMIAKAAFAGTLSLRWMVGNLARASLGPRAFRTFRNLLRAPTIGADISLHDNLTGSKLPTVSVVIPAYNRADTIGEAIDSVLLQSYEPHEIIVIDDRSTDDTVQILEDRYNDRIRLIQVPQNRGPSACRNIGVMASSGDYVAFLDADDIWEPTKLEHQMLELAASDFSASFSFCSLLQINEFGEQHKLPKRPLRENENLADFLLAKGHPIQTSTLVVHRSAAERVSFRESLRRYEDIDYVLRLATVGPAAPVEFPLVHWRRPPSGERLSMTFNQATYRGFLSANFDNLSLRQRLGFCVRNSSDSASVPQKALWCFLILLSIVLGLLSPKSAFGLIARKFLGFDRYVRLRSILTFPIGRPR